MRQSRTRDLGRDVHHDAMAVADVAPEPGAEVTDLGTIGTPQGAMAQRIRRRPAQANQLLFVSEAGPGGSWRSRSRTNTGDDGWVVAPSLMPQQPGERVTTARRDAVPRARLARSGARTAVSGPTREADAMRALTRARADPSRALQAATCRRKACWRRHASRDTGRAPRGPAPRRWLSAGVCPTPTPPRVLPEDGRAVHAQSARLPRLDHARPDQGPSWRVQPVVDALQARRGVPCPVAVTRGADMGELTHIETPRARMTGVGLSPSASSSGAPRRQGALPNAGHAQARRALVEGAWASRAPAQGSRHLHLRRATPPKGIQDLRGNAQVRRCQRDRRRVSRGQHPTGVTGAMARERASFRWAMAQEGPVTPSSPDA